MNITELIVDFIRQGNVVEFPGMGTLTGSNVNAYHDASTGTYYPARRTVAMTSQLSGNKAIVRCIADRECVSVETAEQIWNNFVGALSDKLQSNAAGHEFPGIGTLRMEGGKATFFAVDGLDLDADKKHAQPLENVATYTPKNTADPFAAFDRAPETEPEPAVEPDPAPEPEPLNPASEPELVPEPEPVPVVDEKAAAKAAKEAEKEAARKAKEEEAARKAAEREAEKKAAAAKREEEKRQKAEQKEQEARRKASAAQARMVIKEEKRQQKQAEKAAKRERREQNRRLSPVWIVLLILMGLLLIAGGTYYCLTRLYIPATQGENNAEHVELPALSHFSRSLDGVQYEEYMYKDNVAKVSAFMSEYIRQYLQARQFANAYPVFMSRVGDYANLRIRDILSDNRYYPQRFFPFDDYYRNFCYGNLQEFGGYVARCRVQGELMDVDRLDQMLDDIISELGLHPDATTRTVAATAQKGKADKEYKPAVPPAPTFKASKQGFDIIAGFCTKKESADRMANHLKDLGCDAYVINRSGLYYVSMGSASTRTGAEALYNHIKEWYQGDITIKNFNE